METIRTSATMQLTAGAGKQPTVFIEAYSGGPVQIAGRTFVIDTATLQLSKQIKLLADHENKLASLIGHGTAKVEAGRVTVSGVLAADSPAAQHIISLAKSGLLLEASVGVEFDRTAARLVKAGESVNVNNRMIEAISPFTLVNNGILRETSIVPMGADSNTSVSIAAKKGSIMSETTTDPAVTPEQLDTARLQASGIVRLTAKYPGERAAGVAAQAVEEGWTIEKAELEMLRASRPQGNFQIRTPVSPMPDKQLITAALMLHGGRSDLAEKAFGANVAQRAADLRCHSLLDICAASLHTSMLEVPRDRNEMIRAAFSTSSLPVALGNYAEKSAETAFRETGSVWPRICRRRPVNTFHEHQIARVLLAGNLQPLAKGGEIQHGSMSETTKAVQAATKAMMLGIDRQDIINDDLNTFSDTSNALGRSAARTMNDDFATVLLANAGSFFHANNDNYATTGSALAAGTLAAGIAAMMRQTDTEGRNVDVRAQILLVTPTKDYTARQLIQSTEVQRYVTSGTDNQPMGNPLSKLLDVLDEARLENTSFTGYSTTAWYLFAQPADGAVNIALLGGKDTPTIEQEAQPFNMLGVQFRCYLDYGFALGEPIAAYKATGQA